MDDELRDQIYNNMSLKETDELVKIWQKHNSKEWTNVALDVVGEVLRDRLGELPPQNPENRSISSEFDKDYVPSWCEHCNSEGYIFADNFELSYFVICKFCGCETSYVWCPKCQSGGEFVENISAHPFSWTCSICKTNYELPNGFYENPIPLFTEEVLPRNVLERIEKDLKNANHPWQTLKSFVIGLLLVVLLMALGLLPMLLIFTPLPWTIPGFTVTLVIFAGWWWLIGRGLKVFRGRVAERRRTNTKTRPT